MSSRKQGLRGKLRDDRNLETPTTIWAPAPSIWGDGVRSPRSPHCSVAKSSTTVCDTKDCSTPGFPVLHYISEVAQTRALGVSDAIHRWVQTPRWKQEALAKPQHWGGAGGGVQLRRGCSNVPPEEVKQWHEWTEMVPGDCREMLQVHSSRL